MLVGCASAGSATRRRIAAAKIAAQDLSQALAVHTEQLVARGVCVHGSRSGLAPAEGVQVCALPLRLCLCCLAWLAGGHDARRSSPAHGGSAEACEGGDDCDSGASCGRHDDEHDGTDGQAEQAERQAPPEFRL